MDVIKYDNDYINQFLARCKSFPRVKVELIEPNTLRIETERMYEGYAWIGASEHNINNGCKGVKEYNYCLIDSTELYIYFNEYKKERKVINMKDKYTDVMSEISVKNSLINHLERENNRLKVVPNTLREEIKELKEEIEELKEDKKLVHAHDVDDLLGKRNTEYYNLLGSYNTLKAENEELKLLSCNDDCQDDINSLIKLKAENERLKKGFGHGVLVELEQVDSLKEQVEELKEEVREADEMVDKLQTKNEELKSINMKHSSLKEYQAEADEYFHHNENCEKLFFFMVDCSEFNEDGDFNGMLDVSNSIAEFSNDEGSN